ncbi:myosin-3-like isoform X1 [Hibiscus syriacus]|uniref:myosin-3-like isoform X1 n=1 Tax=Hibiscus syriacus TaxID=106335 RepID=UPI00192077AF|nr:myosin-3-like isoform X1 [Hibiscus syriacus]
MEMGSGSLTESGGSATNSSVESLNGFNTGKKISFSTTVSATAIMGTSSKSGEGSSSLSGSGRKGRASGMVQGAQPPRCQVEGCKVDLSDAKAYSLLSNRTWGSRNQASSFGEAMDIVQICKEEQEQAFAMLAVVLWLGNISFQVIDKENLLEASADEALTSAARLMGFAPDELMQAVSTHRIRVGRDNICKKLTLQQAIDARNALAKFIYASLFDWLVEQINKSLEGGKKHIGRRIALSSFV